MEISPSQVEDSFQREIHETYGWDDEIYHIGAKLEPQEQSPAGECPDIIIIFVDASKDIASGIIAAYIYDRLSDLDVDEFEISGGKAVETTKEPIRKHIDKNRQT